MQQPVIRSVQARAEKDTRIASPAHQGAPPKHALRLLNEGPSGLLAVSRRCAHAVNQLVVRAIRPKTENRSEAFSPANGCSVEKTIARGQQRSLRIRAIIAAGEVVEDGVIAP